jgi:hypothetical protein
MLPEISLNILDIAQNSISADSTRIEIMLEMDSAAHVLKINVSDNGKGMTPEIVTQVTDPFFTTRTTRNVGLGVPFFKQAAECTGGSFSIQSTPGEGTQIQALFHTDHIDCMPLGDMNATIHALVTMNEGIDFYYEYKVDDASFYLDTAQMREILGDIPFSSREVSAFLRDYLEENEAELTANQESQ